MFLGLIVLYLPISIAGYAVYGSTVSTDILTAVNDGPIKTAIMALFAIHLFLAFLILMNPVAQEFEDFIDIPQSKQSMHLVLHLVLTLLKPLTLLLLNLI